MRNKHKVPKKKWNKWGRVARYVFNQTYSSVRYNQSVLFPPTAQKLSAQCIKVVAWNTAWLSADFAQEMTLVESSK